MNRLLSWLFVSVFVGTAHAEEFWGNSIKFNFPEVGIEKTVYLGDQMTRQAFGYYVPCFKSNIDYSRKRVGAWYIIRRGGLICRVREDLEGYRPDFTSATNGDGSDPEFFTVFLKISKKSVNYKMNGYSIKKFSIDEFDQAFEETKKLELEQNSLQQIIEYAGKSGDELKFVYTEFTDGMARDKFTRQFTLDLSEGNMGAFKGAIFEVIDASNIEITYKMVRNFQ